MNETYLRLGRAIAAACPPGFEVAELGAQLDGGRVGLWLRTTTDQNWTVDIDPTPYAEQFIALLKPIREDMASDGSAPWKKCVVRLTKGGGLSIDTE